MDCFRTYFTHGQTCDNVRVQSATHWTASVHTLHMPKPVITFVLRVLYAMDCFRTYLTHVAICDNVPVGRMVEWFGKNAIPLPLGAASLLFATQHTYLKNPYFFLFLGNLGCLVRIGFYNGLWRGRQCVGVVTRSRAYIYYKWYNTQRKYRYST